MSVQQILNKVEESIKAIITDKKYNTGGTTQKNEFRKKYASRIEKRREIFSDFSSLMMKNRIFIAMNIQTMIFMLN